MPETDYDLRPANPSGPDLVQLVMVHYTISDLFGFASIACWLCAQIPQVLENIRRQSCEGLALPFLANWFLGDISNLIGCFLTRQLPFQTYLAGYFVLVDCMLLLQYMYYYNPQSKTQPIHGHRRSATLPRQFSVDRYRTLSVVASNVANAASLVAFQAEHVSKRRASPFFHRPGRHRHMEADRSLQHDDNDRESPADMVESFYSEGGRAGSRRVSWSIERRRSRAASVGHPIHRPPPLNLLPNDANVLPTHESQNLLEGYEALPSTVATARGSSVSRRGSTLIFLGVWALFGVGTLTLPEPTNSGSSIRLGTVLSGVMYNLPSTPIATINRGEGITNRSHDMTSITIKDLPQAERDSDDQQTLGRIFAWICTTLYLTSRLPQIWKNYVRKSVEGLSMLLFISAFFGNTFYVASILSSSIQLLPHDASELIRRSIPYLIGSAGTLMFDITIVSQSFCYRPRHRHYSAPVHSDGLEHGLLADDTQPGVEYPSLLNRGRTSQVVTPSLE